MGRAQMDRPIGRIAWIVGLTFALCALAAGSLDPDRWSGGTQAFMLIIAGATVLMNAEAVLAGFGPRRTVAHGHRGDSRMRPAG